VELAQARSKDIAGKQPEQEAARDPYLYAEQEPETTVHQLPPAAFFPKQNRPRKVGFTIDSPLPK
jgi:hypothetical protein